MRSTAGAVVGAATGNPSDPANLLVRSLVPLETITVAGDGSLMTQVHHGTADATSSVDHSGALRDAMAAAGRSSPSMHDLGSLPGSVSRLGEAITRELAP